MTRFIMMSTALVLTTVGVAQAGSLSDPIVEPAPVAVEAPTVSYGGNWTGGYVGLSLGQISTELGGADESGPVYGAYAGYDYDFGRYVLGGELDFQATDDLTVGGTDVDSITRLKLRGGYDAGPALIYVTAGGAQADTSMGTTDGYVAGLGMDYAISDSFTVGGEFLTHKFDDVGGSGNDLDANTFTLRAGFRF